MARRGPAVHEGQRKVHQDQVGLFAFGLRDTFFAIHGDDHLVVQRREHVGNKDAIIWIIFDNKDAAGHQHLPLIGDPARATELSLSIVTLSSAYFLPEFYPPDPSPPLHPI